MVSVIFIIPMLIYVCMSIGIYLFKITAISVLMIRVEICPNIALAFINTIIFSMIMYSKCVRSN